MPWCPSCKTEYQEGILQCADCGAMLVEELPQDMVCITTLPEEAAQGLLAYYEYLGVDYSILEYDRDSDKYRVLVPRQKEEEILKPTADYFAKQTKEQPAPKRTSAPAASSSPYRNKRERLSETRSSASAFLIVGGVGVIAVILMLAGILPFPLAAYGKWIMLGLFTFFLIIGFLDLKKIRRLSEEAAREDTQTDEILSWFLQSYTKESIDAGCELDASEELNYYRRTEYMKELLRSRCTLEEGYADTLTEMLYSQLYD